MERIPVMAGIRDEMIQTSRLKTRVLFSGPADGVPVLFVHGNASSATYWEETMLALPDGYRGIALDQRGYGSADRDQLINATNGMGDLADDLIALLDTLGLQWAHIVGHSMGGSVIWRVLMDYPGRVLSVTFAAPGSPYGFGGTKDNDGTLCYPDGAGSGGGIVNPNFTKYMAEGYRGTEDAQGSPRIVMNSFYWKPPFVPAREEELLSSLLSEHVGERAYPGDSVPSVNWPNVAPGVWGPANALAPIYAGDVEKLFALTPKPPILWIRGAEDQIVSDNSLFDMGTLGKLGAVPGWPGQDIFPPQPMVGQTRAVLEKYAAAGGLYEEIVFEECGHTPYLEKPEAFNEAFHRHLKSVTA
jgi:pimeloyl-ACP methyl ester carboxylesterase